MFLTIALAACVALTFALAIRSHWVGEPRSWFAAWLSCAMVFATMCIGSATINEPPSALTRTYITEFASVTGVVLAITAIVWLAELISRRRQAIAVRQR